MTDKCYGFIYFSIQLCAGQFDRDVYLEGNVLKLIKKKKKKWEIKWEQMCCFVGLTFFLKSAFVWGSWGAFNQGGQLF